MNSLKIDGEGYLYIGGRRLNAIVRSVSVNNEVVYEEQTLLLESGNEKVFNGFGDALMELSVTILEKTEGGTERYSDLQALQNAYKAMENKKAVVYQVYGDIFSAMAIKEAVFSSLSVITVDDTFDCTVALKENNPKVAAVQSQQTSESAAKADAEAEFSAISEEEERQLRELEGSLV